MSRRAEELEYEEGDEGSIVLDIDDAGSGSAERDDEEEEFDNECGFWIVKMLRGPTLGREGMCMKFIICLDELYRKIPAISSSLQ